MKDTISKTLVEYLKKQGAGVGALGGPFGRAGAMIFGERGSNNEFFDFMDKVEKGEGKEELFDELTKSEPIIIEKDKILIGNMVIDKDILLSDLKILPPQVINQIRKKLSRRMSENIVSLSGEKKK